MFPTSRHFGQLARYENKVFDEEPVRGAAREQVARSIRADTPRMMRSRVIWKTGWPSD